MQLVGRADLIKILISKPEELDEVAHLFGYVKVNLPADMDDGSVPKASQSQPHQLRQAKDQSR